MPLNITETEASDAVLTFESMSFFTKIGEVARAAIAERLMSLVNVDIAAFVKADCAKFGFTLKELLRPCNPATFFGTLRANIVKDLLGLGVSVDELREHFWLPKDCSGYQFKFTTAPQRLAQFVKGFIKVRGGWPGIGEMELLYMSMYRSGDGYQTDQMSSIPGYTWQDHEAGTYVRLLPEEPAPDYKLLEGERMTDEERQEWVASVEKAIKRIGAKQSVEVEQNA